MTTVPVCKDCYNQIKAHVKEYISKTIFKLQQTKGGNKCVNI